jgi:hypothetical protein
MDAEDQLHLDSSHTLQTRKLRHREVTCKQWGQDFNSCLTPEPTLSVLPPRSMMYVWGLVDAFILEMCAVPEEAS